MRLKAAKKQGLDVVVVGKGSRVVKQSISSGTVVSSGQRVILVTNGQMYAEPIWLVGK